LRLAVLTTILDVNARERMDAFSQLLIKIAAPRGLIASKTVSSIDEVHIKDSLAAVDFLSHFDERSRVIDIGSGAGLPGIPLAIAHPKLSFTLLDSVGKRIRFLEEVVERLQLDNVKIIQVRAEEAARKEGMREAFDVVLARAVSKVSVEIELTLPFCRIGGRVAFYKTIAQKADVMAALPIMAELGGELLGFESYEIPKMKLIRCLVVIDKLSATPERYPRRVGVPARRPLNVDAT